MPRQNAVPSYRHHRPSGQAIVTLTDAFGRRKDVYLGKFNSKESRVEYARVINEWEARCRALPPKSVLTDLTINELLLSHLQFAQQHYRYTDGSPTSELADFKLSIRPLRELYGHTVAAEFGPVALKAVRQKMIQSGLSRRVINHRIGRLKRIFKWAVSEQLVPGSVLLGLQSVTGLQSGRSEAPDCEPIRPVPPEHVEAILCHLLPPVRAMVQLQRMTGMRPAEVCGMRAVEIDMSGKIWCYRPARHKTAWRGKERVICLGPKAQEILKPFLKLEVQAFLFSPRDALEHQRVERRANRKTPLFPSHIRHMAGKRKPKPKRVPAECYTVRSYEKAIRRACLAAAVPHWSPNQLRHLHATEVRKQFGLEAAQVALGHSKADVTQIYAEANQELAATVAAAIG